jgi:hypothetical protein
MTSWQDEFSVEVEDIQQVLVVKKATLGESFFEFWQDPRLYYRFVCGLHYERHNVPGTKFLAASDSQIIYHPLAVSSRIAPRKFHPPQL